MVSILNMILINISQAAVDVLGIYFKLQSFVFMPVFGLTQGLLPIIGYNFGARNKKRMLSAVKIGCVIGVIIMAAGTALFQLIPDKLIAIYNYSDDMMRIGVRALRIISLCFGSGGARNCILIILSRRGFRREKSVYIGAAPAYCYSAGGVLSVSIR